jgi:hypothetical protein
MVGSAWPPGGAFAGNSPWMARSAAREWESQRNSETLAASCRPAGAGEGGGTAAGGEDAGGGGGAGGPEEGPRRRAGGGVRRAAPGSLLRRPPGRHAGRGDVPPGGGPARTVCPRVAGPRGEPGESGQRAQDPGRPGTRRGRAGRLFCLSGAAAAGAGDCGEGGSELHAPRPGAGQPRPPGVERERSPFGTAAGGPCAGDPQEAGARFAAGREKPGPRGPTR